MNTYEVLSPVTFKAGRFKLTAEQMRRRKYVVRVDEAGIAEPIAEISFKAGEVVETDLEIPKTLHQRIRPASEVAASAANPTGQDAAPAGAAEKKAARKVRGGR